MKTTVKEIYNNKALIRLQNDIEPLIDIIQKHDPSMEIKDNYNMTLLIKMNHNNIDKFEETLSKSLDSWLGKEKITCPIKYVYNIMPLNNNSQFILRL